MFYPHVVVLFNENFATALHQKAASECFSLIKAVVKDFRYRWIIIFFLAEQERISCLYIFILVADFLAIA